MKMHNFTIRGNCLEIVGRVVNPDAERPVTVYDLDFPCGMENMSIEELRDVVKRLKEDLDGLFFSWGKPSNDTIESFEEIWSNKQTDVKDDAHGA